jgi:serine/threonine protein kinase
MILANKYKLLEKLSEGSFGTVYKATNVRTCELVAVKIEYNSLNIDAKSLKNEAKIYQYLLKEPGFPKLKWFGKELCSTQKETNEEEEITYLVIDLLVCSLTTLVKRKGPLSLKLILQIGIQMIKRVETLHGKYLLHRDIKPDNFMLDKNKTLCLIDFGLCKRYDHNGRHIEEKQITSMIGSANFVSLNVHKGIEPSRRDDVISCIYVILYLFLGGDLPWFLEKDMKRMVQIKEQLTNVNANISVNTIMNTSVPQFIKHILTIVYKLAFNAEPDYKELINILETELRN